MGACLHRGINNGDPTHAIAPAVGRNAPEQPHSPQRQPLAPQPVPLSLQMPVLVPSPVVSSNGDDNNGDPTHAIVPTVDSSVPQQSAPPQPQSDVTQLLQQPPLPASSTSPAVSRFLASGENDPYYVLEHSEDVCSRFIIGEELGRGRYDVTHVCRERATGLRYACKSISKRKLRDRDDFRREITVMQHLSGQSNIVEFMGAYEDAESVHLVTELCDGGELFDRIIADGSYSERKAAGIFRGIINAVDVSHFLGVIHRDLKPENFLLTTKDGRAVPKATDFEFSAFVERGKEYEETVGSPYYIAPEVLTRRRYAKEADVWSAGVILYTLLSGAPPFWARKGEEDLSNEKGVFDAVLKGGGIDFRSAPWPTISSSAKDLIRKMLKQDPKQRITALEVLVHPWTREGPIGTASDEPLDSAVLARLKQFNAMNKLKKMARRVIVEHRSEEEIKRLKQKLVNKDSKNRGKITLEELTLGLARLESKLSDAEVRQLMEAADIDGGGSTDYMEFVSATLHQDRPKRDEHLYRPFQQFYEGEGSGFITLDEHGVQTVSEVDTDNVSRSQLKGTNYGKFRARRRGECSRRAEVFRASLETINEEE